MGASHSTHLPWLMRQVRDAAMTTIFPRSCRVCGAIVESWDDGIACRPCWLEIESTIAKTEPCTRCGLRLKQSLPGAPSGGRRCGSCENLAIVVARSCGPHSGALRESVLWLKRRPQISPCLRGMIAEASGEIYAISPFELIIPVPLHPTRLAERSFNQASIIASVVASLSGCRIDSTSLVRNRYTARHRLGMAVGERRRSVARAFTLRADRSIVGRSILIVDDVLTTGSTADEIAVTLLSHGARETSLLTISHADHIF